MTFSLNQQSEGRSWSSGGIFGSDRGISCVGLRTNLRVAASGPCGGSRDNDERSDALLLVDGEKHPLSKTGIGPRLLLVDLPNYLRLPITHLL